MEAMIGIFAGLFTSVMSGVILYAIKSGQKSAQDREADRDEREKLTLDAINAIFCVNKELVRCVRGEKPNGELTEAYEYEREVKHKIEEYARDKASHT